MNTDIGELIEGIEIENPINVAVVAGLVVSLIPFVVMTISLVGALREQSALQEDYGAAISSIERMRTMQEQTPETLRERIAEIKEELDSLLAGMPTRGEARAERLKYYTYASEVDVELVRVERVVISEEEGGDYYDKQRFLLEARGLAHNLMRFLARVVNGPYDTFILSDIRIESDEPSRMEANLEIFFSELDLDEPLPAPVPMETSPSGEGRRNLDHGRVLELHEEFQKTVGGRD